MALLWLALAGDFWMAVPAYQMAGSDGGRVCRSGLLPKSPSTHPKLRATYFPFSSLAPPSVLVNPHPTILFPKDTDQALLYNKV